MRELIVSKNDGGQRLDKYLFKYMKDAPSSLIYKMLRKKNIVYNGKKSDGKDIICQGDSIKIFMAEETIEKFQGRAKAEDIDEGLNKKVPPIVYEDDNLILFNKPSGLLSQKDVDSSVSLNEIGLAYLLSNKKIDEAALDTYRPSVVNRLDRNTCGLIIFAKNYASANSLSLMLRERTMHKYYRCIVKGYIKDEFIISGYLVKDEKTNKVSIIKNGDRENIYTRVKPIAVGDGITLAEILLITGKTHQIRAHLADIGHPLIGDYKYGDKQINDIYKKKYGVKSQLLCACRLEFPECGGQLSNLSGRIFEITLPDVFERILKDGDMEIQRTQRVYAGGFNKQNK